MTAKNMHPTLPLLQILTSLESVQLRPIPTPRGTGECFVRYTVGLAGDELTRHYTLSYAMQLSKKEELPIDKIEDLYLDRLLGKMQYDLIQKNSDLWPWEVGVRFHPSRPWKTRSLVKEDWMLMFAEVLYPDIAHFTVE